MATVVVGVDGSQPSIAALRWAVEEARQRHAVLRVVHAWQLPLLAGADESALDPEYLRLRRDEAERVLTRVLAHVLADTDGVQIVPEAVEGRAAKVLVDEAQHADLLVVGSRGRGGFAQLLLGSVSHQCAQHAACPVAIVRAAQHRHRAAPRRERHASQPARRW